MCAGKMGDGTSADWRTQQNAHKISHIYLVTTVCASLFFLLASKKGTHTEQIRFSQRCRWPFLFIVRCSPFRTTASSTTRSIKMWGWQPRNLFIISIWWNRCESVPSFTGLGCRFSGVDINFSSCQARRQQEVVSSVSVSLHIMCRWCRHKTEEKRKYNKYFPWPLQDDSRFSSYAFCCASDLYRHTT